MDTFKKFIQNIFIENGYQVLGIVLEDISFVKHKDHEDYWAVAEGVDKYQTQEKIFQALQARFWKEHPLAEKNTSLLILHDIGTKELEKNEIIEIENDPIYFKKYVLCYSCDSYEQLAAMLNDSSVSEFAMSEDMFSTMKNEVKFGPASLLYIIMHKLPFVPLESHPERMAHKGILYSNASNAGQLMDFLKGLTDDEQEIDMAVRNLIKAEHDEETGD